MLKAHDILVLLQLLCAQQALQTMHKPELSYAKLAAATGLDRSEVRHSLERLQDSRLVRGQAFSPQRMAISNMLVSGVPYFLPGKVGDAVVSGVPTGAALPEVGSGLRGCGATLVWASAAGEAQGLPIEPLCESAVAAAQRSPALHHYLALIDLLRHPGCGVRERAQARAMLEARILAHTTTLPPSAAPQPAYLG